MFDVKICSFLSVLGAAAGFAMGHVSDFSFLGVAASAAAYAVACGFWGPLYAFAILAIAEKLSGIPDSKEEGSKWTDTMPG